MESAELDRDAVSSVYDELCKLYELGWDRGGHQSIHFGYYDDGTEDARTAVANTIRHLSTAAEIDSDDRVLDIGCGGGDDAVWNAHNRDSTVVGVDINERFLDFATEHAQASGVADQVTFRQDDFHRLATVEDESHDVVWGLESICHSSRKSTVFEQAHRVLADGGQIALGDLFQRTTTLPPQARRRVNTIQDCMRVRLAVIEEIETKLLDSGFETVEIDDITDAIRPGSKQSYRASFVNYPLSRLLQLFGRATDSQVGYFRSSYHIHRLIESDALGYYFVTAEKR